MRSPALRRLRQGEHDAQYGALPGLGIHCEAAAQVADSFLDSQQPHSALLSGVESLPIILDGEQQAVWLLTNRDSHVRGLRVLHAVVQRFLDDPVHAGLVLFGKFFGNLLGRHL